MSEHETGDALSAQERAVVEFTGRSPLFRGIKPGILAALHQ